MPMMGSVAGGGELSFAEAIGLLKDEPAYQTRMQHLAKHVEDAKVTLAQAAENNRKAEETRKLTAGMADNAEKAMLEARRLNEEADRKVAAAAAQVLALAAQNVAWQKQVAEQKVQADQQLRDAFAAREKEVVAKEQKLLADLKEFKAWKADEDVKIEAFMMLKKAKETELGRREASVREGEAKLIANLEEVQAMRNDLKAKLDKIKAISAA